MKEKDLQNAIIQYLNLHGHFVWRNNTGAFVLESAGKKRFMRAGIKGSPDIIGIAKDGRFIGIECKSKGRKSTLEQEVFLEQIRARGGIGIVAYSLKDACFW